MNICEHLRGILDYEVSQGNAVREVNENAWTNAELVVNMNKPLSTDCISSNIEPDDCIIFWENNDTHYLKQNGYYCKRCKHAIAGPI